MKLRLKDGTEHPVLEGTTSTVIRMSLETLEEIDAARKVFTKENLAEYWFTDDAGKVYGEYGHYVLTDISYRVADGKYLASYILRVLSDTELRLDALEVGQETQDGAIEELAVMMGGGD